MRRLGLTRFKAVETHKQSRALKEIDLRHLFRQKSLEFFKRQFTLTHNSSRYIPASLPGQFPRVRDARIGREGKWVMTQIAETVRPSRSSGRCWRRVIQSWATPSTVWSIASDRTSGLPLIFHPCRLRLFNSRTIHWTSLS